MIFYFYLNLKVNISTYPTRKKKTWRYLAPFSILDGDCAEKDLATLIQVAASKLKTGKAPGIDDLLPEIVTAAVEAAPQKC